ncbi:unnamed protein product [Closterium sp. Yama58-4]|nr:unnamed protein product [Closterium sp. Yama58-4]
MEIVERVVACSHPSLPSTRPLARASLPAIPFPPLTPLIAAAPLSDAARISTRLLPRPLSFTPLLRAARLPSPPSARVVAARFIARCVGAGGSRRGKRWRWPRHRGRCVAGHVWLPVSPHLHIPPVPLTAFPPHPLPPTQASFSSVDLRLLSCRCSRPPPFLPPSLPRPTYLLHLTHLPSSPTCLFRLPLRCVHPPSFSLPPSGSGHIPNATPHPFLSSPSPPSLTHPSLLPAAPLLPAPLLPPPSPAPPCFPRYPLLPPPSLLPLPSMFPPPSFLPCPPCFPPPSLRPFPLLLPPFSIAPAAPAPPPAAPGPAAPAPPAAPAAVDPAVAGSELRRRFLEFYAARGHAVLPSASLVPADPTVLLTIAGMLPFKPVFLAQRCVRTNDVENVGRTACHHTFFEMLGNFSFGDYFKQDACQWAWQLATEEFGIPEERIWVSVFRDDDETYAIWKDQVGVAPERIQRLGEEDNFWASGPTGPCGPCSELYYDFHPERGIHGACCLPCAVCAVLCALCCVPSAVCAVLCALCCVRCAVCPVLCALCCVPCAVCPVLCALCCVRCAVCAVLCALCCVPCAVCAVLCALCSVPCAVCAVLCALCCVPCDVCPVLCALCDVRCAVCPVLCALCCVRCAVCPVLCALCCVRCAVCPVLCALCCVRCAVCPVLCALCCVRCAVCAVLCALCCVPLSQDLGDDSRFIELYNLVFMESNRRDDGSLEPLRCKNIDTGLGLERLAQILQQVPSNYETDLIFPIVQRAAKLAGVDYHSADDDTKRMLKVIGNHARAVVHLVADGVSPSNLGRGYVVRRLVRRLVRTTRLLGINAATTHNHSDSANGNGSAAGSSDSAFLPIIARQVIAMSAHINGNVAERAERVVEELRREEERFLATLERGKKMLDLLLSQALSHAADSTAAHAAADGAAAGGEGVGVVVGAVLSGRDAFVLYDTYGFPVEMTEEVARERGVAVDMAGFEQQMAAQRKQSQAAHSAIKLAVGGAAADLAGQVPETEFVGYSCLASSSPVLALVVDGRVVERAAAGQAVDVVLARTPLYAEGGGQIADWGHMRVLQGTEGEGEGAVVRVRDVQRAGGGLWLHRGEVEEGKVCVGDEVEAVVDEKQRLRAQAHHTATHLLQAALREQLGPDVAHAGSLVAFDRLRFDFHFPRALTPSELAAVEARVNKWIAAGADVTAANMHIADAKAAGAIAMFGEKYTMRPSPVGTKYGAGAIAMFGEKYGEGSSEPQVALRGVSVRGSEHMSPLQHISPPRPLLLPPLSSPQQVRVIDVPGISMELCGGTDVGNTAHIRAFKLLSEAGIAAGVRRIEAVAGEAAVDLLHQWDGVVKALSSSLKVKAEEVPARVAVLQEELRAARSEAESLRGDLAVARSQLLLGQAETVGAMGCRVLVAELPGVTADALKTAAESLAAQLSAGGEGGSSESAVVLASGSSEEGKVAIVALLSPAVVKAGVNAGKLAGAMVRVCGGGGGGRPNFAQAGGRQPEKLPEALAVGRAELMKQLGA